MAIRICRVCGREYESCRAKSREPGGFVWLEVACSAECGDVYLSQLKEARSKKLELPTPATERRGRRAAPIEPILEKYPAEEPQSELGAGFEREYQISE